MRVAVVYNRPEHTPPEEHWLRRSGLDPAILDPQFRDESEFGVVSQVESIVGALEGAGHEALPFSPQDAAELCQLLDREAPDLVFNCCEGFLGESKLEMNVAAAFELFGIPYTGSPAATLAMALNKGITKAILRAHGVSTPRYVVLAADQRKASHSLRYPVIVKPLSEDASIGIDVHAVVRSEAALRRRVRFVWEEFRQPALVEEYIDGRELNVSLLATSPGEFTPLPISEILFDDLPRGTPRVVGYEAKWIKGSPCFAGTVPRCPAEVDRSLGDRVRNLALEAARALGLRDYGRVDFRVRDSDGRPFVLEVNPNPDLSQDSGFMRAARASGRTYESTIVQIVEGAAGRCHAPPSRSVRGG